MSLGEFYRAQDEILGRSVVIVLYRLADDPLFLKRSTREKEREIYTEREVLTRGGVRLGKVTRRWLGKVVPVSPVALTKKKQRSKEEEHATRRRDLVGCGNGESESPLMFL